MKGFKVGLALTAGILAEVQGTNFTYDQQHFYLDGSPLQIIGGQFDPQRIPRGFWKDRLAMAKAMGLNTVFSYIFWHDLEPQPGEWDFTGNNDISAWYEAVQNAGLYAVIRPGPYVCGETEWGGYPGWLNNIKNMSVRTNNPQFLAASKTYLEQLGPHVQKYQVSEGGPILMVQVENEYGWFGSDLAYKEAQLKQIKSVFDITPYTTDASTQAQVQDGSIPGVLTLTDNEHPETAYAAHDQYVTNPAQAGPHIDSEFYAWWASVWGPNNTHWTYVNDGPRREIFINDTDWALGINGSLNFYMFHGGTNYGFGNGALDFGDGYQAFTTSYDYGAPLDESGRPTITYYELRAVISKHVSSIPDVPTVPPLQQIDSFKLKPIKGLFDNLDDVTHVTAKSPVTMESLDAYTGYVLYEAKIHDAIDGVVKPGDKPRDRVIVYVNGVRQGVIDPIHTVVNTVSVSLHPGDKLQLFVENLGRVDFDGAMSDQRKGIVGNVTVGGTDVYGWTSYSLPADTAPTNFKGQESIGSNDGPPMWYHGSFENKNNGQAADTYLAISGIKGQAYVNGFNLGRYWMVGPQQQLYVPGSLLKKGRNDLVLLELEPQVEPLTAEGVPLRSWFSNDDPDCGSCQYAPTRTAPA
ncbi:beta-calactosidase [Penicillium riverlandense]|uniref:beta-calactosidase n=1 Tax=Penicillium riverlandense TaxID=1903569 RepID=UPI002547B17F|nr:beta-calactosidase [Penicillium riverlandense]KAJ5808284.1 beta-calactosidase [Penicillium riverlandense]